MNNQTALNEIFNTLSNIGIVDTKREFYEDWLNRSEGYVRYLKHANKQPSTDALAVCSSKLKHYSKLLQQKNTAQNGLVKQFQKKHSKPHTQQM